MNAPNQCPYCRRWELYGDGYGTPVDEMEGDKTVVDCTGLKALPENLKVGVSIYLDGCTATVPKHLQKQVVR